MQRRSRVLLAAAFVLVLTALIAAFFLVVPAHVESTPPKIVVSYGTEAHANSISDLQLYLAINSSRLQSGQALAITLFEENPTGSLVNVSSASDYVTRDLGIGISPCTFVNEPISFAVFSGNFGAGNFTQGLPLQLDNPSLIYSCPPTWTVRYWEFQSEGNTTVLDGCQTIHCFSQGLIFDNAQVVVVQGTYTKGQSTVEDFSPGVYTIVGGDEWGAAVLLHFTIS
ncbi:MAG TPA: hypothetical protein VEJ36_02570 [Nitrososphaerales archaeon]|nr:hypothetical protein [Nitrososphaerales archaeon]